MFRETDFDIFPDFKKYSETFLLVVFKYNKDY
jgi:hypothetical protein